MNDDIPDDLNMALETEWILEEEPPPPPPDNETASLPADIQAILNQLAPQQNNPEEYARVTDLTRHSPLPAPHDIKREKVTPASEVFTARLDMLRERVPVLVASFGLDKLVPPCWDKHLPLISVLSALEASHSSRFDPSAPGVAETDFLRDLQICRTELTYLMDGKECITGTHTPWVSRQWLHDGIPEHLDHLHDYF